LLVLKGHDSSMCKRRTRFDLNEIHHRRGMCVFNRNERNEIKKWFLKMKRARARPASRKNKRPRARFGRFGKHSTRERTPEERMHRTGRLKMH